MISKLAKAHESWVFKIISAAVALSFISLFGVSGYISSAGQNQTVVNVNGQKTTQSEFSYRLQKETNALQNIAGEDFEISEELHNTLAEGVLRRIISESVLDQTMKKYGIYFPRAFVQQVVYSRPEFMNPLNGQFNPELFKRYLSATGMSEEEYIAAVKRLMAEKLLVSDLIDGFAVPSVLVNAIHKMDNQRKSFRYVTVSPADIKIERQISDDEIEQYYGDFAERFMIPELRDADVLYLTNDEVLKKYGATAEDAADYYNENIRDYDQPEKRDVLQMVFANKETAEKALAEVSAGKSFETVAKELKAENADGLSLGAVAEDELAESLAAAVFEMKPNKPNVVEVAGTWQVISVKNIIPAAKTPLKAVEAEIIEILNNENLYDALRKAAAEIDDALAAGQSFEDVARKLGAKIVKVTGISEETPLADAPAGLSSLASSLDFNETVFSYGLDEVSSAEEFDDGIAVIKVTKIDEPRMPEIAEIKDEIIGMWTVQEKNALAKEIADGIAADTEDGSVLAESAKARDLPVYRSEPLSRNDTFAGLTPAEIAELFVVEDGEVKVFEHSGNNFIIVTPFETVNYRDELTPEVLENVKQRAVSSMVADMYKAALDSYAEDFKIKVDYRRAGFSE